MAANFKVFVDGNRLPAEDINNFLAKQCVVQVDGQNDLTPLTEYGVRMAMTLDTGALWFYTDLAGWSPLEIDGLLTQDTADARYLLQVDAEGIYLTKTEAADFLTGDEIASTYLAKLTAEGLYLTQTDAQQDYLGKTEASTTYVSNLTAQQLYLSKTDAANTYLTEIDAGSLYISKTDNAGTYVTSISGDVITTGTVNAARIGAGTMTGVTINTKSSGTRVQLRSDDVEFYGPSGLAGRISGGSTLNINSFLNGTAIQVNGSTVFSINGSGVALSPGTGFNSDINCSGTVRADGQISTSGGYTSGGTSLGANVYSAGAVRGNADSSTAYCEFTASGAIVRKTVDIDSSSYNYAVWNRNTGALDIGLSTSSDVRLKENITDTSLGLNFINDVRPIEFDFIQPGSSFDEGRQYGVVAQELKEVLDAHNVPENNGILNTFEDTDYYSVTKDQLIAPMIKAIQELSAKNEELEARLAALEGGNG